MRERRLTVSRLYPSPTFSRRRPWSTIRRGEDPVPFLRLSGKWLDRAGFEIGDRVRVEVGNGQLVLTALGEE